MHDIEFIAKTDFEDGYVAVVLRDLPVNSVDFRSYGIESVCGSTRESHAGLTSREAFIEYGLHLQRLYERDVELV